MQTHSRRHAAPVLIAGMVAAAGLVMSRPAAASVPTVTSRWQPASTSRQTARSTRISTSQATPVSISLSNNARVLHITLHVIPDEARAAILERGLVVWFDPTGGQARQFGIEYPVAPRHGDSTTANGHAPCGPQPRGFRWHHATASASAHARHGKTKQPIYHGVGFDPQEMLRAERRDGRLKHLVVLGAAPTDRHVLRLSQAHGIHVALTDASGVLTYRLTVPLARGAAAPYGVGAAAGTTIGIGLTPPPPSTRNHLRQHRRSSFARRMAQFWGGENQRAQGPPPIKVWMRARLASSPAAG